MYNLYIDEKKKRELIKERLEEEQQKKIREKHKKSTDAKAKKYEDKVMNFAINMIHHPIVVSSYKSPLKLMDEMLPHHNNYDNGKGQRISKKNFSFKTFQTDKERLRVQEESMRKTKELQEAKNNYLNQPNMRYKFRTELERVFESINSYSFGRANKNIIDQQLKEMEARKISRKKKEDKDSDCNSNNSRTLTADGDSFVSDADGNNSGKKRKESPTKKHVQQFMVNGRIKKLNEGAKFLLGEFHNKTHFKGMTSKYIEALRENGKEKNYGWMRANSSHKTYHHKDTSSMNVRLIPSPKKRETVTSTAHKRESLIEEKSKVKHEKRHAKTRSLEDYYIHNFNFNEDNDDLIAENPLLYNQNASNLKPKEKFVSYNDESLNFLKNLSKRETIKENNEPIVARKKVVINPIATIPKEKSRSMKKTRHILESGAVPYNVRLHSGRDYLLIDKEAFSKEDTEGVMKKILLKCNFMQLKHPHNTSRLISGNGKLMQTNNMSIAEFEKKYNL